MYLFEQDMGNVHETLAWFSDMLRRARLIVIASFPMRVSWFDCEFRPGYSWPLATFLMRIATVDDVPH